MVDGMSSAERVRTIGLCMIVKNEAHVILRCLDSVRPLVDYVLIEDTGSTDGTQQIVMDWLVAGRSSRRDHRRAVARFRL